MKLIAGITAKIFSLFICLFFAPFILEAFSPQFSWQDGVAHLIPTLIMIGITIVAWKKPVLGGFLFIVTGILLAIVMRFQWSKIYICAFPLITGSLFLYSSRKESEKK